VHNIRPIITTLILIWNVLCGGCASGEAVMPSIWLDNTVNADSARQLRIYKDALFQGASEQSRHDAAVELLLRQDRQSREILLEALLSKDNRTARQAVCKGLISCRSLGAAIRNSNDFLEGLVAILVDDSGLDARLAAEAMLIFKYRELSGRLEKLVRSDEVDRRIRLNVIYALKIRPGKEAMSELIRLLEDADPEIAGAAESALQDSFGISIGTDKDVWREILKDLQRKSPSEIRRERLLQQETRIRKLQAERDLWRDLYLAGLDKEYEGMNEASRGELLFEKLSSNHKAVKLWALDKVSHRSAGTALPAKFGAGLLSLISDEDRDVRLATAKVLSKMSDLNPAEKLLEQFGIEQYDDVRLAIFEALGEACYYAFSPGSQIELPSGVRDKTLELAGNYIVEQDGNKAKKGAEVIRKLLELAGLEPAQAQKYLELIADRAKQAKTQGGPVYGELLGIMATLCGRGGYYRTEAAKLFETAFMEGLAVEQDASVRQAAVAGLTNIDGIRALIVFKERGLADDQNPAIRKAVIELAGRVGAHQDLEWLAKKVDSSVNSQAAYEAIAEILARQKAAVVSDWAKNLASDGAGIEQVRLLFEMAEKKAEGENDQDVLWTVRDALLGIYLKSNDAAGVGRLMSARLGKQDIDDKDGWIAQIEAYLGSEQVEQPAKEKLVEILEQIETAPQTAQRPAWAEQLKIWSAGQKLQ